MYHWQKQNTQGTGNQYRIRVNCLVLFDTAICKRTVQSFHAGKDVRPAIPFRFCGSGTQLRKTQWKIN